ncbi:hypothetical protein D9M71_412920 [compost metagenome]
MGAQGQGQILAWLQGTDAKEILPRLDAVGLEDLIDGLGFTGVEARGHTQRCHHEALGRQCEPGLRLLGDVLRVRQNQPRPLYAVGQSPLDFAQACRWLGVGIVQVREVMQCDDGRAVERQRPQTRLVIQINGLGRALIKTLLLQPAPCLIGSRNLSQQRRQTRVTGHRRLRQSRTPAPAVEQRQLDVRFAGQGRRQFGDVVADARARGLEDAGVKGNSHADSQAPSYRCADCAGCVRPVAHSPRASSANASYPG